MALHDCEMALHDCEMTLHDCEMTLHDCEMTLHDCEMALHGARDEGVSNGVCKCQDNQKTVSSVCDAGVLPRLRT